MSPTSGRITDPARLRAVAASGLMDTPPERAFDDLVTAAARALDAPYAFLTVVDEARSFWKASVGVEPDGPRGTSVDGSFCRYVIETPAPLLIPDARIDPRACRNPAVTALGVVAWAGVPLMGADGQVLGSFCVVDTRPRAWEERHGEVLQALAGLARHQIGLRRRMVEAERTGDRLERLYAVSRQASLAVTREEVARAFLAEGRLAVTAIGGSLRLLDPDGRRLELVGADGDSERFVDIFGRSIPVDAELVCARAFATRTRVAITDRDQLAVHLPETLRRLRDTPVQAFVALPLLDRSREPLGVMTLSFSSPRELEPAEIEVLEALAALCAQTVERVGFIERERSLRADLERLQQVTAGLASALTVDEVAQVAVVNGVAAMGADGGCLGLLHEDGRTMHNVAWVGYPEAIRREWDAYPADVHAPMTDCLATGTAIFLPDARAIRERYPDLVDLIDRLDDRAWAALPLRRGEQKLGALFVSFRRERRFAAQERRLMHTIAEQTRDALERSRLHATTEERRRRQTLVNQIVTRMDATLGVEERAMTLARQLVPGMADFAGVELLTERGTPRPVAALHRDPRQRATVARRWAAPGTVLSPLHAGSRRVGTMLVGREPGGAAFTGADIRLLAALAEKAGHSLQNAVLFEQEHHIADVLQQSLLPSGLPEVDGVEIAAAYIPAGAANIVGGDFYDVVPDDDGAVVIVGDVCGKGAEAARLTALCRHTLRTALLMRPATPTHELAALLNTAVHGTSHRVEFCSLVLVRLTRDDGHVRLRCCVAGHPPPYVMRANGRIQAVRSGGGLIGIRPDAAFTEHPVTLRPGDTLLLYTDGLTEARRGTAFFGEERLAADLSALSGTPPHELLDAVRDRLEHWETDQARRDDVAMLAVRADGGHVGDRFRRRYPARPESLRPMRLALSRWLADHDVPPAVIADVTLAVGEAAANAVEHAYRSPGGMVHITAGAGPTGITLAVRDHGVWQRQPAPADRGRGLPLIRAVMDEVRVHATPAGTTVRMRKRRDEA